MFETASYEKAYIYISKTEVCEEDPWSRVESSKFRKMFAGVNVSFHL